jgi:DNA-binding transcriptional ArsR family regulator
VSDGSAPCRGALSDEDRAFILNAAALRSMLTYKALARRMGLAPRTVRTVIDNERKRRARRG